VKLPLETVIIHGGAYGTDSWADEIARKLGIATRAYPANWDKYGKRAGIFRSMEMLDQKPEMVIAFWNGESRGTSFTINEAKKRGIPVEVIPL